MSKMEVVSYLKSMTEYFNEVLNNRNSLALFYEYLMFFCVPILWETMPTSTTLHMVVVTGLMVVS